MPGTTASTTSIGRLIDQVNLAQPLVQLEPQVFAWAAETFGQSVYSLQQLISLYDKHRYGDEDRPRWHAMDLYFGVGAIKALQRRPPTGWPGYIEAFERKRVVQRLRSNDTTDFSRLRELEIELGGILLSDRACPFVLVCPQPDNTWLTVGFESLMLFSQSPMRGTHGKEALVRSHIPTPVD